MKKVVFCVLPIFLLFLVWQILTWTPPENRLLFPAPTDVFRKLVDHFPRFWLHSSVTFREMLGGLCLAAFLAFPLGWSMMRSQACRSILQSFFILVQCLPMFTLAPLMITWFGWSYTAIVIPTTLMVVFPLTINIYKGLMATPKDYLDFFRVHQGTEGQIFLKVRVPYALPHIFSGLRISAAIAGVGAVAGEWAGAQEGLGVYIQECRRNFDLEGVFGALFCLAFMSLSFYGLITLLERRLVKAR